VLGSLALARGGRLYWRTGSLVRSALLDPAPPALPKKPDPNPRGARRCYPRGSVTLAASTRIRVYRAPDPDPHLANDDARTFVACGLRDGRRTSIGDEWPPDIGFEIHGVEFAGRFAAVGVRECSKYGCTTAVRVVDATGAKGPRSRSVSGDRIYDIALKPNGSLAFMWSRLRDGAAPNRELRRCDSQGCAALDSSAEIETGSLALSAASDVYWTNAGQPRSATLD
jgi:hypothetical protein